VLAYALLFKISYSPATYLSLLPLTLGVMLACSFDISASNILGLVCAFGSTLVFVSQNIVFKKLMPSTGSASVHGPASGTINPLSTAQTSAKLDKINLLFYSSGMAFLSMIPLWAYSDMPTLIALWLDPDSVHLPIKVNRGAPPSVPFYFFVNGTVHFAQNLLAFAILSSTSPVTYSIASLVKRIAVICLAIIWFNQKVHPVQAAGIALTGIGLWMYNAAKRDVEKGEKKVRRMEAVKDGMLPLNMADQKLLDERSETSTPVPGDKGMYASPAPSYGFGDYAMPPVSHSSAVKGGYPFDDGKVKRGTQQGYVVPYPSVSTALPSPPPSNASSPPFHATTNIPPFDDTTSFNGFNGARRRMSIEPHSKLGVTPTRHVHDDSRRIGRSVDEKEEILVDFEPRKGSGTVAPTGA
jgi:solute carrier family 35 protein E1